MARPNNPDPPARDDEQVRYHQSQVQVIQLLGQRVPKVDIAQALGYEDRGEAFQMINRAIRGALVHARKDQLRDVHFDRLEKLYAAIEPEVMKGDGTPVDGNKVNALLRILARQARLTGIDMPATEEWDGEDSADAHDEAGEMLADRLDKFMMLGAEMRVAQLGNGMTDAQQIAMVMAKREREREEDRSEGERMA